MAKGEGVPPDVVTALREGSSPNHPKYGPLSDLARAMVQGRGTVPDSVLQRFLDAGYTRAQALEVVLGMGFSLMANYASHLVDPPLDDPICDLAWHRETPAAIA
jgi:alkylhydroperoxidase family enzyme